jgi:hypothetical protein
VGTKKAKSKEKATPRNAPKKNSPKPANLAEVRQEITNLVSGEAANMARAVMDEGKKGQLAPVKYMFEMAGLYPAAEGTETAKPEQESLANLLLNKLGIPLEPVVVDEDEVWVNMKPVGSKPDLEDEAQEEKAVDRSSAVDEEGSGDGPVTSETIP